MICIKCGGESFVIESTIVITEFYHISNLGKVSKQPTKVIVNDTDMTDNENLIRCKDCKQSYMVSGSDRDFLLHTEYIGFNLNDESVQTTEY